jgi:hypothetical protein
MLLYPRMALACGLAAPMILLIAWLWRTDIKA